MSGETRGWLASMKPTAIAILVLCAPAPAATTEINDQMER